jgi:hypothetical protein
VTLNLSNIVPLSQQTTPHPPQKPTLHPSGAIFSFTEFARAFGDRGYLNTLLMLGLSPCSKSHQTTDSEEMVGEVGLGTLPYDFYLDLYDIHALHLVSPLISAQDDLSPFLPDI